MSEQSRRHAAEVEQHLTDTLKWITALASRVDRFMPTISEVAYEPMWFLRNPDTVGESVGSSNQS